ncbi:MAG TPA: hypothetical protein VIE43_27250 [Thermoanaerobaculia bacterium]|nr:hypothetical protein [Thermoanaerobaculia bacterium]
MRSGIGKALAIALFMIPTFMISTFMIPAGAAAQDSGPDCGTHPELCAYKTALDNLAKGEAIADSANTLAIPWQEADTFVLALGHSANGAVFKSVADLWEKARVDKQVGAPAKVSGTTDLVSRPSTPELLGLALQLGALTETVSGTTATFHANAEGAYKAILGEPVICLACEDSPWRKLNLSASFDLSEQNTQQVPATGPATPSTPATAAVQVPQSSRQLSSLVARYDISNPLDPRSKQFKDAWSKAYSSHQSDLRKALETLEQSLRAIFDPLGKDLQLGSLGGKANATFVADAGNPDKLKTDFESYFHQVAGIARQDIPGLDQKLEAATAAFAAYSQVNYDILQDVQEADVRRQFTAQYTFSRPQSQPETHELKLIVGLTPKSTSGALFTLNLASSFYGQVPTGAKYGRLRDFQFAAQFDRPLGNFVNHPATLTLAGYVQYQRDPSVLDIGSGNLAPGTTITLPQNAQVLLGTQGTLAIAQAKITINTKSGVNIPISVSWANKTDLLNSHDVRGNFGITYDFNSLSDLFGGSPSP